MPHIALIGLHYCDIMSVSMFSTVNFQVYFSAAFMMHCKSGKSVNGIQASAEYQQ